MAVTIKLTTTGTTVNMTIASDEWRLLENWEPVVATPTGDGSIPEYVVDVLPVITTGTSDDNFAAQLQDLHLLAQRAAEYWADENQTIPVYFHRQLTGESGETRTLVRAIEFDVDERFGSWIDTCPPITEGRLGNIAITHHPTWERETAVAASGAVGISVLGGKADYTDVVGDFPARPYYLRWYAAATGVFQYLWTGFRSDTRAGTANNFVSLWECEDGSPIAETTVTTDATASPGGGGNTKMRIDTTVATGTGTTLTSCFSMSLSQAAGANTAAQFGTSVVLLRAKVDAGTAQVRLEQRGVGALTSVFGPVVDISATSYSIYNLGTVTWPMRDRKGLPTSLLAATYDDTELIALWARLKTGLPTTLDCDCYVMIPADEYFVLIGNVGVTSTVDAYFGVSPEDTWTGVSVNSATSKMQDICPVSPSGAGIPVGEGRLFFCAANASLVAPGIADTVSVLLSTYPRWLSLRGAE